MIYATVNMTIGDYSSTCDNKILLYRGDKNVEIRIVMKGNKFTVLDSTYAQMIIRRPSTTSVFSEPAPIQNDTVVFVITEDMIDELKEIGEYTFQVRLYDDTMTARATLPPCNSALIIERPIAVEGEAAVNLAIVNDSAVMLADTTISEEDIFTEDNKYNKTIWVDGDLITDARLNKIEDALYYINENGGNGGGGATAPYISTELPETVMVGSDENFDLNLFFNSPNMGKGTLRVFINDVDVMSIKIDQGDSTSVVPGNLFAKGTNKVVVYVLDRVGVMSNSLVFYIRYGSTEISSDFDPYSAYDYGATIRYYFTPTALDTSLSLTFYMSIDGQVQQGVNCTSDTRGYYTFPTNLSADSHYCEAYVVDSNGTKSNVLSFNLIILDVDTLVVASDTKEVSAEEGEQVSLDYKVYMKYNTSFIANVYVDGALVNTGVCNADFNYYKTSSLTKGTHTIKLEVFDVTETHSDYITWTVSVTDSTYEMLQPVNAGAMFIGTAVNKTNTDERKQYFIGHDQEGNEVLGALSNFAYNSESGWVNDELIISGNSHVEIPVQPLANNAKYGFTLDIEFTSKQIGVPDAEVLTLWNDETNCGVKITTEKLILQSSNGNKCDLYFTDNEKTHVMFVIDRQELKAKIYLNGVMCEAFHLNDYTVDGVAYLDDFTVNSNIILGGLNKNGYCKIRNLRVYQVALTTDEIINNFISCEIDKAKQRELSEFQKGNDLPTLYVYCDFSGLGKDDKKPCKIVYNSTNEELYGKSFNLDHKQSQLQYQGTSSMAYPIKNYRLNLRDENGDKWYYTLPTAQPECRFTLKADFMSSGHWTNTGMAKFINDKLYNYNVNDEKSMNPFKWNHVQNGGKVNDFRETITGFPCRLILVNDGETPLNTGQNEPTPGNTKDMGIFNFNNDKDNVTTLGFNSDIFPNCASYEVTANSDTSAGAFMSYKSNQIIEFSEVQVKADERYYTTMYTAPLIRAGAVIRTDGELLKGMRYNEGEFTIFGTSLTITKQADGSYKVRHNDKGVYYRLLFDINAEPPTYMEIDDVRYELRIVEEYPESVVKEPYIDNSNELAYLKESFELRHPDEDDVAEDWGFMGVEEEVAVPTLEYTSDNITATEPTIMTDKILLSSYSFPTSESNIIKIVRVHYYNANLEQVSYWDSRGGSFEQYLTDDTEYISFEIICAQPSNDTLENVLANSGMLIGTPIKLVRTDSLSNKMIYDTIEIQKAEGTGLKALIDWVDNCTDEEFVRDFEQHFHKDYTLRYFCLVTLIGAVDNLGKNMMLDTADNKIYFPRFYDIDTICSYDNSGQLKFDVDIEMEQGYWNTSSSRLWTRIRDLMHADIVTTYNDMRQNGVSYENMMHYIYDEQIAKIPQSYYNKDYDVKYAPFADSYIGMAHGDTYEHVKRWLKQRFTFVDTLFDYAPSYNNDVLTIRANTTELMTLEIETYTPVYQHLSWYNGQMDKKKIDGKVSVEFSGTAQAATDQEVLIYGGSNVKSIKGITSMNPNRMLIGSATKLVEIDAHDCPLLADINANKANLSPHEYLNKVNLSNCPLLEGNLRLNNSPLIQELDIRGTGITGMNLPSSIRNLQVLKLPNTMTELTLNDAGMLHTLEFDEGVKVQSVAMTNCNALENVVNFDLLQTPSITLNNSYNTAAELYFRDTTNLSLSNMPNLERVIFTPNNEYETFEMINVANAPDYKVTTFNCPKLSTFMTTAPYRESYNNVSGYIDKEIEVLDEVTLTENYSPKGVSFIYYNIFTDFENGGYIEVEVDLSTCINDLENIISFGIDIDKWAGSSKQIHMHYNTQTANIVVFDAINNKSINIPVTRIAIIRLDASGVYINGTKCCENSLIGLNSISIGSQEGRVRSNAFYNYIKYYGYAPVIVQAKDYGDIQPNTTFTANSIDISSTQFTDVKLLCTTDTNTLKLPTTVKNFYCDSSFDLDTDYLEDGEYDVVHGELVEQYTTDYEGEVVKVVEEHVTIAVKDIDTTWKDGYSISANGDEITTSNRCITDFIRVSPNSLMSVPSGNFASLVQYDINKNYITGGNWVNNVTLDANCAYVRLDFLISNPPFGRDDGQTLTFTPYKELPPNLIPSSADGSLIFSMYAPSNTVAPASGTWDLHGLEFDNFHTFGMNNDVKPSEDSYVKVAGVSNMKVFTGGSSRDIQYGNIYYDSGKKDTRCITNIKLPAGYYVIKRSDGGAPTVYISTTPDGTQSVAYNMNNGRTFDTDIYITMGLNKDYFPITINDVQYRIEDMELVDTLSILRETTGLDNGNIMASDYGSTMYTHGDDIFEELGELKSLSMPARYDDYNITIKNAYIAPKTHNTMLYPLLVNEDNPITGTLDYTNYAGKHLSWSFAYTDEEYVNITQPKDELLNSYEYKYNAFYDTEYEFDNPYEVAIYTSSASGVLPGFNAEFTYTYDEIDNGDGTYTTKIYADSLDNLPTQISFYNIKTIMSVERLNTSNVTTMNSMFCWCGNLISVNTKTFDTNNATDMRMMFYNCLSLTSLDLSGFNTSNVTDMNNMFCWCGNLTSLDVSSFETSKVTAMNDMFRGCSSLTSLDVSGFDTSNVANMSNMFRDCPKLTSLDLSNFDTSNVTNMSYMFYGCSGLTFLNISGEYIKRSEFDNIVSQINALRSDVDNLLQNNIGENGGEVLDYDPIMSIENDIAVNRFNTSNVTDMSYMFYGCSGLTSLDVSGFDTSNVTNMNGMFQNCRGLTSLDIGEWNASKVENMYETFRKCSSITELNLSGFTNVNDWGSFCRDCTNLVNITGLDVSKYSTNSGGNVNKYLSFEGCTSLRKIKDLNVSFTSAMATADNLTITNDYWILSSWGWFRGLTNLVDITFTGQVELYDTMTTYYIFRGCDTTKFTYATWNTFVSIFPTTSTSKSITLGGTQSILDAVPDEIKLALTQKGYTLTFRE